jgi:hypothetical protein
MGGFAAVLREHRAHRSPEARDGKARWIHNAVIAAR